MALIKRLSPINWFIRILGLCLIILGIFILCAVGMIYLMNRQPVIQEPLKQANEVSQARSRHDLPPKTFTINGVEWKLTADKSLPQDAPIERGQTLLAETYCSTRTVLYDPGQDNADLHDTIWHELMHAGACRGTEHVLDYWNSEGVHHRGDGYYRMGEYLSDLMRDNPDLAKWLAK